jgi:hypothetical protein
VHLRRRLLVTAESLCVDESMPTDIGGIPLHPLVVHAVTVLLPLSALGVLLIAVVPRWRAKYATLVLISTALATVLTPVATSSGESLEERVAESELVDRHAELGDLMIWFALPLLLAAVALWWLARKEQADQGVGRGLTLVISVLSVAVAVAASVQIVLVGHSGAKSVWEGTPAASQGEGDEG